MRVILIQILLFLFASCGRINAHIEANEGYEAYLKKDYIQAVSHYETVLKNMPNNPTILRNLGFAHFEAARENKDANAIRYHNQEAIKYLFEVVRKYPEDKELSALLVEIWTQTDRLEEATRYYLQYTTEHPHDEDAWRVLGQIEVRRGNYEAALITYEKREALDPKNLQIITGKAILCWEWLRSGNIRSNEKAVKIATLGLKAALQVDDISPKHPTALVYAGLLLRQRASHQSNTQNSRQDLLEAHTLLERVRIRNKGA